MGNRIKAHVKSRGPYTQRNKPENKKGRHKSRRPKRSTVQEMGQQPYQGVEAGPRSTTRKRPVHAARISKKQH